MSYQSDSDDSNDGVDYEAEAADWDNGGDDLSLQLPFAQVLRESLSKKDWKTEYLKKNARLQLPDDKVLAPEEIEGAQAGTVSALLRTRTRIVRLAELLRIAVSDAGPALIHGSVALAYMLESDRELLTSIMENEVVEMFNIQNYPFVRIDHNTTMQAYMAWQEARLGLAIEKLIKDTEEEKANLLSRLGGNKKNYPLLRECKEGFNRSLLQMARRARMRRQCLTTVRVTFKTEPEEAVRLYGSERVVLGVITYRKMPEQVQARVNETAFTVKTVLDIVADARKDHEAYFLSQAGVYTAQRRMRTVPSATVFQFFDQTTYFENTVCKRATDAVNEGLSGAAAVDKVFKITAEGDENQCQRSFGHWILVVFNTTFGSSFSNEYKRRIAGNCNDPELRKFLIELRDEMISVLHTYDATLKSRGTQLDENGEVSVIKDTKRAMVSSDPRVEGERPDYDALVRMAEQQYRPLMRKRQRVRETSSIRGMQLSASLTTADVDDGLPLNEHLDPEHIRSIAAARAESERKKAEKESMALPHPNPSAFPMQYDSDLVPRTISSAEIPACSAIVKELGVLERLKQRVLRRTATEVAVGTHLIQTATNATTASVVMATKAAAARVERVERKDGVASIEVGPQAAAEARNQTPFKRVAGSDSRRMLNEESLKPVPLSEVMQSADTETGAVQSVVGTLDQRAKAYFYLSHFDPETMFTDPDEILEATMNPAKMEGVENALKFFRTINRVPLAAAFKVIRAAQQSRVPARTYEETNHAILRSDVVRNAALAIVDQTIPIYMRMATYKSPLLSLRGRKRKDPSESPVDEE